MPSVHVALGPRSYDIEIGGGLLAQLGKMLAAKQKVTHAVVVTDENVSDPHAKRVAESFAQTGVAECDLFVLEAGEPSKSVETAATLWNEMLSGGADRKSVVIAVGGGVIGDLAGWVAASFARGLAFVQVPTSLLAMVDSSVGGKVGVNLPGGKNMVGAFWQPRGVFIDTDTLATLPEREYLSGLAEVVKYGVILDAEFFAWQEANVAAIRARDPAALAHLIARSCRLKADVVEKDEREETGLRAVLNYGHTFGHALENVAGYGELLHGEAISIGMMCAARLALAMGRIHPSVIDRQRDLLVALGLPIDLPANIDRDALVTAMKGDKKVEHGKLRFVLPTRIGHVELVAGVEMDAAKKALDG